MVKLLRKCKEIHDVHLSKFYVFSGQKSIFPHYCIQIVKNEIQLQV